MTTGTFNETLGMPNFFMECYLKRAAEELVENLNRGVDNEDFRLRASFLDTAFERRVARDAQLRADIACGKHVVVFYHEVSSIRKAIALVQALELVNVNLVADELDATITSIGTDRPRTKREDEFLRLRGGVRSLTAVSATHFSTIALMRHLVVPFDMIESCQTLLERTNYR